jgi:predicted nucleic acid-binding Zn ribbon protein
VRDEPDHRHCKVCGAVVDPDDQVCSEACGTKRAALQRSRRNYQMVLYGVMAVLAIVLLLNLSR